jgi:hypothetical protein
MKPKYTLHKQGFIVTSDEQIKEGDVVLEKYGDGSLKLSTCTPMSKLISEEYSKSFQTKVIAQQDQIDFSALTEEEQKKIGWFDVAPFVNKHFEKYWDKEDGTKMTRDEITAEMMTSLLVEQASYVAGFQKAQELLSDRRFTLDEVRQSFWKCFENRGLGYSVTMGDLEVELNKSLWKVEVEMEKETLYTDDGLEKIKILKLD